MNTACYTVLDSPIGTLLITGNGHALTGLFTSGHASKDEQTAEYSDNDPVLKQAGEQLTAYFSGDLKTFDLPLAPQGTTFQNTVWQALLAIPYGQTWSYGQLAQHIGNPKASRAVGLANGRNPISIIIPCHRVIGADGSLTGYGGGIERKQWLLAHETAAVVPNTVHQV